MSFPADDLDLPFSGTRLRPFPFSFNFPIQEGFDFLTDVITADDGSEQRVAVRNPERPRHRIKATVVAFDRDEAQHLEALLFGWNRFTYGVPMWQDAMVLSVNAEAGDTELTVTDTAGRDLAQRLVDEEDVPCLIWRAHDDWEPFLLASLDATTLTARDPIAGDWTKQQTLIVPLQLMLLPEEVEITRAARATAQVTLEFISGQVPVSLNPPCAAEEEEEDSIGARVEMVRGTGVGSVPYTTFADYGFDSANVAAIGRPCPGPPNDLFGYSRSATYGGVYFWDNGQMWEGGKGLDTGFSKCTRKCPDEFKAIMSGKGIGNTPGVDASPGMEGTLPDGTSLAPGGDKVVGSAFTGSGCKSSPDAPTTRHCAIVMANFMGGIGLGVALSNGDQVCSYGLYDAGAPGGIAYYELNPASAFSSIVVEIKHGYCFRLKGIAAYKGIKIVVEDVINPDDPREDWTYGTPEVTTHDFDSGDYTDALTGGPGAFVKCLAGGSDLIGGAHGPVDGFQGYSTAFDDEMARVTVYLYKDDMVDRLVWMDHFRPMYVDAAVVV